MRRFTTHPAALRNEDANAFIDKARDTLLARMESTYREIEAHKKKGGKDPMQLGLGIAICCSADAIIEKLQHAAKSGKILQRDIAVSVQSGMTQTIREHYDKPDSAQKPYLQQLLDRLDPPPRTPKEIYANLDGMVMIMANSYTKDLKTLFDEHIGRTFEGTADELNINDPKVFPKMLYERLGGRNAEMGKIACDRLLTDILQGPLGSITTTDDKPLSEALKGKIDNFARCYIGKGFFPDFKPELESKAKTLKTNILDDMKKEGFQGDYSTFLNRIAEIATQRTNELLSLIRGKNSR